MIRRLSALVLWTYFAWYLAATLASLSGGPGEAGPIAALLTLFVGVVGWLRLHRDAARPLQRVELEPTR